MTLTILTDDQISELLSNLTKEELERFMGVLRGALHEYSTATTVPSSTTTNGKENVAPVTAAEIHQPERTSISSKATGATTLFMPSSSSVGTGIKVVTLTSPSANPELDTPKENIKPTGAITLFSPYGTPLGFLHASTLTAFRTALASLLLISKRDTSHLRTITVFGTGAQAYWHIRLTLLLLGPHIHQINILSRSFSPSVSSLLRSFVTSPHRSTESWSHTQFSVLTPAHNEYSRLLEEQLLEADVIICCTPSTVPLWDGAILTTHEGRQKGRLIVAIGSYAPHMQEIPQEHAEEGGVVVVDTLDGALKEAGELIGAGVRPGELVELGELVMLEDYHEHRIHHSHHPHPHHHHPHSHHHNDKKDEKENQHKNGNEAGVVGGEGEGDKDKEKDKDREAGDKDKDNDKEGDDKDHQQLAKWLAKGNVIYKSVGLGLMDLSVGMEMVKFAGEKNVGSRVEGSRGTC
ncbi:hypothetical protein B0T21DRAFT_455519 [Apiosordaria backusii]|uniref:NAD(P)-binding protein n=1 Tax=Apiosordaria backusii TaxID=314023 RepID=A0AA39ZV90_9PEZI|nr:hypothetical protein B0T21DRAFT_455519 [Apiosordaria backusii]